MRTCIVCGKGKLENAADIALEIEGYIFILKGERCTHCREEFPHEEETQQAITIARKLGVWPEPMKLYRHLSKSGGGLMFRIPVDLERQLKLNEKTEIAISKLNGKIIIEPAET
ncbi:MAG: AbrB/MazE/SpoVT family DNA-binding domain-containing protein [Nanoarchaeota archaeon]